MNSPKFNADQFYGIELNKEQIDFVNAIFDPDNLCVFCNAKAGTGKTLVTLGINPNVAIISESNIAAQKSGKAYIQFMTHTYIRGANISDAIVA